MIRDTTLQTGDTQPKKPLFVYQPPQKWNLPDLKEVWEYRELLFYFVWRDLKIRYRQTILGMLWAVIPQVISMLIYSFLFGQIARLPSEGVSYLVFSFTGLTAWGLFSKGLYAASGSLLTGAGLTSKIYFPRLIVTFSSVISSMLDSVISFGLLIILMILFQTRLTWGALILPLYIIIAILTALAVGIWAAALTVQYRDVAQIINILINLWLYASPVAYSPMLIPKGIMQQIYWYNPMAGVIQGFRWGLLGSQPPPAIPLVVSTIVVLVMLVTGLIYFQRVEKTFIDLI